ncbi:MAG: T9SS type A sorting domain-containing protein, partial [Bacteroidales bacterium]|nr:T9SS type A sorting domain-containing protein [Bacteroidales bacterium]
LNVELSTDNGQNWQAIAEGVDATQGYLYWTVEGNPSQSCFIRISDASDPSKFGLSGMFAILETPVISLTSPVGGEIWNTGTTETISWEYDQPGASYVYIDYTLDNGQTWNFINYALIDGPQGSIEWTTPEINSDQCRIRIMDFNLQFVADTSDSFTILAYPETPICMVTVDSATNMNVIVWEKPASDLINNFVVYKESNEANVYEIIGTVNYAAESMVTDTNSNPNIKSYRYKIGFQDAEGNLFPAGDFHQTIHLTINQGVGNSWNLIWTNYLGFNVSSYNIYRKAGNGNFEMISSISASFTSYTDLSAPEGDVFYMVEVVNPNGCSPNRDGEYASAWSNVASNSFAGVNDNINELPLSTYPNPANDKLNISFSEALQGSVIILLSDLTGRTVYSRQVEDMKMNSVYTINTADLKEGIYMMKVSSEKGSATRKIIVKH